MPPAPSYAESDVSQLISPIRKRHTGIFVLVGLLAIAAAIWMIYLLTHQMSQSIGYIR